MAILNQYNYYYINSFNNREGKCEKPEVRVHGGWPGTGIRKWDDKDYYYVEFINGDAFYHHPIEKLVDYETYQKILNGSITLCISHIHEAYHYVIEDIYKDVVIASKIPPSNILYLSNSFDIGNEIDAISKKYNLPKIRSEFISLFEYVGKYEIENRNDCFTTDTLNRLDYTKKFLSFNGLWRPHRLELVSFLEAFNIREQGYVSLNAVPCEIPSMDDMFPRILQWNKDNTCAYNLLMQNEKKVKQLNRLYIDTDPNQNWNGAPYYSADKKLYENTYFSIVTETLCNPDESGAGITLGRALSEKTFKPIMNCHPFMIVGVKGILKTLKQLGYKTFSPYIDESYDDESDGHKRIYKIAKEAKRLVNLNSFELNEFASFCRDITEYNLQHLKSRNKFNFQMT
jgi:hypothetical protein